MIKFLHTHTYKMLLEHQEEDIKGIFARRANHNKFLQCFFARYNTSTELENVRRFEVVSRFHPGHQWTKTRLIRFL